MISNKLDKVVNKSSEEWHWDSSLRWLWKSDNTKNWKVYSTEASGHWWNDRNLVQERSR